MWWRLSFLFISLFWVVMNVLLWRSEFGERRRRTTTVPVHAVWHKILTAPDNSSLDITHHGKKVGFCRWSPNVGEEISTGKRADADLPLEGMVKHVSGYTIDLEGNFALQDFANRLRFDLKMQVSTNHAWREFDLRLSLRPTAWLLRGRADEQTLSFRSDDMTGKTERTFRFADLANPAGLLAEFGETMLPATAAAMRMPLGQTNTAQISLGLQWEAFNDWLDFGRNKLRIYRLQARLLDHYQIKVFVSPVGEILRVELPDELVLVNDAILNL